MTNGTKLILRHALRDLEPIRIQKSEEKSEFTELLVYCRTVDS